YFAESSVSRQLSRSGWPDGAHRNVPCRSIKRRKKLACRVERRCGRGVIGLCAGTFITSGRRGTRLKTRGSNESQIAVWFYPACRRGETAHVVTLDQCRRGER